MRAATSARPFPSPRRPAAPTAHRPPRLPKEGRGATGVRLLFAGALLAGYLPGLWAGRAGQTGLGQQLAAYYSQAEHFSAWGPLCLDQLAAAFLQLFFVLLCGFFTAGPVLLGLFFVAKGLFWGLCAANILQQSGVAGLLRYWVSAYLPALCLFFLCLWLAGYAAQLSGGLFQSVFLGGAPRGQLHAAARRLGVRFGVALLCAGLFSVVFSALGAFADRLGG